MKNMKYLMLILIVAVVGCCQTEKNNKPYGVAVINGTGLNYSAAYVDCDSFKFISPQEVIIYNNGTPMTIKADNHDTRTYNQYLNR